MISYCRGDVTNENSFANPVNLVGVMGKGLALTVRRRWPGCDLPYRRACTTGELASAGVLAWPKPGGGWIFHTPTKRHWRQPSDLGFVRVSAASLRAEAERLQVQSVGVPRLGCGLGGLQWTQVHTMPRRDTGAERGELPAVRDGARGGNANAPILIDGQVRAGAERARRRGREARDAMNATRKAGAR